MVPNDVEIVQNLQKLTIPTEYVGSNVQSDTSLATSSHTINIDHDVQMSDPESEVHSPYNLVSVAKDQQLTKICDQNEQSHLRNSEKYIVSRNSVRFKNSRKFWCFSTGRT